MKAFTAEKVFEEPRPSISSSFGSGEKAETVSEARSNSLSCPTLVGSDPPSPTPPSIDLQNREPTPRLPPIDPYFDHQKKKRSRPGGHHGERSSFRASLIFQRIKSKHDLEMQRDGPLIEEVEPESPARVHVSSRQRAGSRTDNEGWSYSREPFPRLHRMPSITSSMASSSRAATMTSASSRGRPIHHDAVCSPKQFVPISNHVRCPSQAASFAFSHSTVSSPQTLGQPAGKHEEWPLKCRNMTEARAPEQKAEVERFTVLHSDPRSRSIPVRSRYSTVPSLSRLPRVAVSSKLAESPDEDSREIGKDRQNPGIALRPLDVNKTMNKARMVQ